MTTLNFMAPVISVERLNRQISHAGRLCQIVA